MESIKGSVTVIPTEPGKAVLIPDVAQLDRSIQTIQWSLVGADGVKFGPSGIVFKVDQPGYNNWPGTQPARLGDCQYSAWVNLKVPHGEPPQRYQYDIWVDFGDGERKVDLFFSRDRIEEPIDPDMENQPQP